jgi:hypothetical protein
MNREDLEENPSFCWVTTRWGRHKARIILETMIDNKYYIIAEMEDDQFKEEEKIQTFKRNQVEYIN